MLYKSLAAGVIAFGLPALATPSLIFTSSYPIVAGTSGSLSTIKYADGKLEVINKGAEVCGTDPSWLEFAGEHIYCLDELWASGTAGALYNVKATKDGKTLTVVNKLDTLAGPVSSIRYGQNRKGLAVAA